MIHRYLTGSYRTHETSEGGRFKKDIVVDGQCNLLLIRDEGDHPPVSFCRDFYFLLINLFKMLYNNVNLGFFVYSLA